MLLPQNGEICLKMARTGYFLFEDNVFSMVSKLTSQLTPGHFQQDNNPRKTALNRNKHL